MDRLPQRAGHTEAEEYPGERPDRPHHGQAADHALGVSPVRSFRALDRLRTVVAELHRGWQRLIFHQAGYFTESVTVGTVRGRNDLGPGGLESAETRFDLVE
jgi:hypothetical protein